jgi:hypothetical protein
VTASKSKRTSTSSFWTMGPATVAVDTASGLARSVLEARMRTVALTSLWVKLSPARSRSATPTRESSDGTKPCMTDPFRMGGVPHPKRVVGSGSFS